jgi:hypothetical protein
MFRFDFTSNNATHLTQKPKKEQNNRNDSHCNQAVRRARVKCFSSSPTTTTKLVFKNDEGRFLPALLTIFEEPNLGGL